VVKKLNSMRVLETQGVRYEVLSFPDTIHSAVGVAAYYSLPPVQVYKTLVVVLSQGKPALVLIAGNREIHLKQLA
jgi:prolyl-tRNA editing enzyme YbaK/EbsC (Cys-tRNA(Pro) deacylase)